MTVVRLVRLVSVSLVYVSAVAAVAGAGAAPRLGTQLPPRLAASTGKTFYVAQNGSDSASGSASHPWRTVQHAAAALRPGQRALVRSGTYPGLVFARSGTAGAPITIAAAPGARPVLEAAHGPGNTYAAEIPGSYFRLSGFVLEGATGTSSADVYLEGTASHVEISHDEIRGSQDQGVFADPTTSDIQIIGNRIHGNGAGLPGEHQSHGMYLEGRNDFVADNLVYGQRHGFGLQIYPLNHDSVIVDNTVLDNGLSGIVLGGDGGVSGVVVRNNIFAFNGEWGIAHDKANPQGCVVDHNLMYGNRAGTVEGGFAGADFSRGNIVANPRLGGSSLRPGPGSRAARAADPAWSTRVDFAGRRRPARPAIGAVEPLSR